MQAKYYNPAIGAFLAFDPHPGDEDEPLSQNGYSYTNNPNKYIDPSGKIYQYVGAILSGGMFSFITNIAGLVAKYSVKKASKKFFTKKAGIAFVKGAFLAAIGDGAVGYAVKRLVANKVKSL